MNNLRTFPLSSCKNLPPYFFMVHLFHRLYGVDVPAYRFYAILEYVNFQDVAQYVTNMRALLRFMQLCNSRAGYCGTQCSC